MKSTSGEQSPHRLMQLVPKSLLRKVGGQPVVLRLLGISREQRRDMVLERRKLFQLWDLEREADDAEKLALYFLLPSVRFRTFWSTIRGLKRVGKGRPAPLGSFSVDYFLLKRLAPDLPERCAAITQPQVSLADEVRSSLTEALTDKKFKEDELSFAPFALWDKIEHGLADWSNLDTAKKEEVAEAVSALSAVSKSTYFLESMFGRVADAQAYFDEHPIGDETPDKPNGDTHEVDGEARLDDVTSQGESAGSEQGLEVTWSSLMRELVTVGQRAGAEGPSLASLDRLTSLLRQCEGMRAAVEAREDPLQQVRNDLDTLVERIAAVTNKHGKGRIDSDADISGLVRREWEQVLAGADTPSDRDVLAVGVRTALEAVDQRCREIEEAAQALGELGTRRSSLEEGISRVVSTKERLQHNRDLANVIAQAADAELALADLLSSLSSVACPASTKADSGGAATSVGKLGQAGQTAGQPLDAGSTARSPEPVSGAPSVDEAGARAEVQRAEREGPATTSREDVGERGVGSSLQSGKAVKTAGQTEVAVSAGSNGATVQTQQPEGAVSTLSTPSTPNPESEEAETASVEATSEEIVSTRSDHVVWDALRVGEVGAAYHCALQISEGQSQGVVPSPVLIELVALAPHIQSPEGSIGRRITALYEQLDKGAFDTGSEAWQLANGLLLFAATFRPSLIAPTSGATGVRSYVHSLPANVFELGRAVASTGERLLGLRTSAGFASVRDTLAWETDAKALAAKVNDWLETTVKNKLQFQAATVVWQSWVRPGGGGIVRRLLEPIALSTAARGTVSELVRQLKDTDEFDRLVEASDRRIRSGDRIQAGALNQLRQRVSAAIELAEKWLELEEGEPKRVDYVAKELHALSHRFDELLKPALAELADLKLWRSTEWSIVRAAVAPAERALKDVQALFAPNFEPPPEPECGEILSSAFLRVPSVQVGDDWSIDAGRDEIIDAARRLLGDELDWRAAVQDRIERGDFAGARRALTVLCGTTGESDATLEQRLADALHHARAEARRLLVGVQQELETALVYGAVSESDRAGWAAQLADLDRSLDGSERLDKVREGLQLIRRRVSEARQEQLTALSHRISALQLPAGSDVRRRLEETLVSGDVLTSNEYLQTYEETHELPEIGAKEGDAFEDFFPTTAKSLEKFLDELGPRHQELTGMVDRGQPFGGLTFEGVGKPQRQSGAKMLDAWFRLKRQQRGGGEPDQIKQLFVELGFEVLEVRRDPLSRERAEFLLSTRAIADRSICPAPQFGSQAKGQYRVLCVWGRPTDEDLIAHVGETIANRPEIVLYFGRLSERRRRDLAHASREKRRRFLVVDELLLVFLAAQSRSRLATLFRCALPFTYIEPFVTTSGLVPPELFFGRIDELNSIREANGSCIIYGGRQLGKTALLREAERTFHATARQRYAKWIDLKNEGIGSNRDVHDIWVILRRELVELGVLRPETPEPGPSRKGSLDALVNAITSWCTQHPDGRLLLLLDEADRFLEVDGRQDFQHTTRLKNLMESTQRHFKVVMAGLHNVLRSVEQVNHPLAHFGHPIEIGPLSGKEWRQAMALIEQPLHDAGYRFEPGQLIVRILAQTNYYPSLIQLYGERLVRLITQGPHWRSLGPLAGPRYPISERIVDEAFKSRELRDAIRLRFDFTLQLDPRYEVVAYSIAYAVRSGEASVADGLTQAQIRAGVEEVWSVGFADTNETEFRVLLDEMVGLGVLRHTADGRYSLRNPNILLLMGTRDDIFAKLVAASYRPRPQGFEPDIFRALAPKKLGGHRRSPLTFTQEWRLVRGPSGVTVIAGNEASGIGEVAEFLATRLGQGQVRVLQEDADLQGLRHWLNTEVERRAEKETTLLLIPPTVSWNALWVEAAFSKIEKLKAADRVARVVFLADPATTRDLVDDFGRLQGIGVDYFTLGPWAPGFLQQWLEDMEVAGVDESARNEIGEQTGSWPSVLTSLVLKDKMDVNRLKKAIAATLGDAGFRDAERRRLGLDIGGASPAIRLFKEACRKGTREFDEVDLPELAECVGLTAEQVPQWLGWGDAMHLIEKSGPGVWKINSLVAELVEV